MKKVVISLVMLGTTGVMFVSMMVARGQREAISARIVMTERADVFQTIGLSGVMAYADERYVLAAETGMIERLCVQEGQRVGFGEMLVEYDANDRERVASAFAAGMTLGNKTTDAIQNWNPAVMDATVQRADMDYTVRQVLLENGATVVAGTPLCRVSAADQEIRCIAAAADARKIVPGMWAWISSRGERHGVAYIESVERMQDGQLAGQSGYIVLLRAEKHIDLEEGEAVEVDVYLKGGCDVVSLPLEAITERDTVWWVNDEGRCTEIAAEIVVCDEKRAWVSLKEGIRVAIGEFEEGQRVVEATE